jgi:hypothetical protein
MSSLWTPGGEVPVGRDRDQPRSRPEPPPAEPPPAEGAPPDEAAMAAEVQRYLLEAPAEQVVAQHAMGLYELAVLHLSQPEPRLTEARLAIDGLAALVGGLEGRLGEAGRQLHDLLPQLQMAFVQLADRSRGAGTEPEGDS